jgi:dienelactone hydrolase
MWRRSFLLALAAPPKNRASLIAAMQEVMGPFPQHPRGPVAVEVLEETAEAKFVRRKIRYESERECRVPAHLFLPKVRKPAPAMLCLHQTTKFGKDEPAGLGGLSSLHYARELAERGFVTLAPDYCRFGEYQIDPYAMGYASATMKGIWDHSRAVDLLQSMPEVRRGHIGTIGHSLGGHNSLFVAAFDQRVRAVVTSCGFTSFAKYYGGNLKGWSHAGYMPRIASEYGASAAKMPFEFSDVLRLILPRKIFVYAPLEDSNFERTGVVDAIRDAGGSQRVVLRQPHGTHDFPREFREDAYRHLEKWLG